MQSADRSKLRLRRGNGHESQLASLLLLKTSPLLHMCVYMRRYSACMQPHAGQFCSLCKTSGVVVHMVCVLWCVCV